jgi:hypothetical protein
MGSYRDSQAAPASTGGTYRQQDRPKAKPRKDQMLGLAAGLTRPIDNMAEWAMQVPAIRKFDEGAADLLGMTSSSEAIDQHEQYLKDQAANGVVPGAIGKTVGSLVSGAPVLAITKNPYLVGAGQGMLSSEAEDGVGLAMDAALGAGLNKAGGVVVDKLASVAAPVIDPAVKLLRDAGVRLTPGQVKGGKAMVAEDRAMSRPRVGDSIAADRRQGIEDFNRGAVNRALLTIGVKVPDHIKTGHDAVAFAQDAVGKAYDNIMPKLTLKVDPRMAVGWRKAQQVVATLPEREADLFDKITQATLKFGLNGDMAGRPLSVAVRDLKKMAAGYSSSASEAERQLGEALSHLDDGVHSALSAQNPGYAAALKATNTAYKGTRIVSDAAKGADEGIASTGQVKTAVRQNDRSKNQRKTAAGRAFMQDYSEAGRKVLPSKTPDSGTAGRTNSDKLIANIKGALDQAKYKADKAYSDFLVAPRPQIAQDLAALLRRHKSSAGLLSAGGVPGLLSGLLANE